MRKACCYIFFFLLLSIRAFPAFDFNDRLQKAYQQIIRFKFDDGKKLLDEEGRANPSNQLTLLYYNYIDFLKAFISEEKNDFNSFSNGCSRRLNSLREE